DRERCSHEDGLINLGGSDWLGLADEGGVARFTQLKRRQFDPDFRMESFQMDLVFAVELIGDFRGPEVFQPKAEFLGHSSVLLLVSGACKGRRTCEAQLSSERSRASLPSLVKPSAP